MPGLIINADDLGYSPAVNRAIDDLFRAGLVTSTSLLVNQVASEEGAAIARRSPHLSVGVHLNLSRGRPLLAPDLVPSLVDDSGAFCDPRQLFRRALLGQIRWYEAAAELEAQVEWALARGVQIDNLDTHVHFHTLPAARRLTEWLANRYHVEAWRTPYVLSTILPIRLWTDVLATPPKPGHLLSPDYLLSLHQWGDRLLSDARVARLLAKPGIVTELVVHPGYDPDDALPVLDQLQPPRRQAELDLVSSPAFQGWLDTLGVRLMGFADLRHREA
jgi:predicted glycoside hydrolase/deacetylase ChbG (UPF0249 family)